MAYAELLAVDQSRYPGLHPVLNMHLLANKKAYFGVAPFKLTAPTECRTELVDLKVGGAARALPERGTYFTGVLGKSGPIQVRLEHDKGKVVGEYFYEKYGPPIQLEGSAIGQQVVLKELIKEKPKATLSLTKGPTGWFGEWKSLDGKKRFPLRLNLVATECFIEHSGPLEAHVQTCYPVLKGKAGARFNVLLASAYNHNYREAIKGFEEEFKDEDVDEELLTRYRSESSATIHYFSDDLISVRETNWWYWGGAHGILGTGDLNYWWQNGKVKKLELYDLFDSRKNWRTSVGHYLRRSLTRKEPKPVLPRTDTEAVETAFTFSPAGVEFHYPYYRFHARVLVPYTVLRPFLNKTGPLARWAK